MELSPYSRKLIVPSASVLWPHHMSKAISTTEQQTISDDAHDISGGAHSHGLQCSIAPNHSHVVVLRTKTTVRPA